MKIFSQIIIILIVVVLSAACNSDKIKNDNSTTDKEVGNIVKKDSTNVDKSSIDYLITLMGLSDSEIKKEIGKEFVKVDEGGLAFSKYKIRVWFDSINMTGVDEIFTQNPEIDFNGVKIGDKIDSFTNAFGDPVKIQIADDVVRYQYKGYELEVYRDIKTKEVFAVYIKK